MDDKEFETAIQRLKYNAAQDFSVDEMKYYILGHKRASAKKYKEVLQLTRETRNAYNMGYNHGKAQDDFLVVIFRKKMKELKQTVI